MLGLKLNHVSKSDYRTFLQPSLIILLHVVYMDRGCLYYRYVHYVSFLDNEKHYLGP